MVFIGIRAVKLKEWAGPEGGPNWKNAKIIHFNPHFIKNVDESKMQIIMDDNTIYRIDDEGLQIFLAAMYGDDGEVE
jgi:hypothetical protein